MCIGAVRSVMVIVTGGPGSVMVCERTFTLRAGCVMTDQRPFTCHVFIGTSLDGFIARTNGDLEWLTSRGEAAGEYGFQEFVDRVDTVAMGRVTYGNWLSLGTDQWPFHGKHVAVLSTRLDADDDPRIAVYPNEARFPVSYRVLLELLELGGAPGHPVVLRARWTVAGPDGRALAVGASDLEQAPASASWADYVAAHRAALGALTHEIAERIAEAS